MESDLHIVGLSNLMVDSTVELPDEVFLKLGLENLNDHNNINHPEKRRHVENVLKDYDQERFPGGGAANVIDGVANLGGKTALIGVAGKNKGQIDNNGQFILNDLKKKNVKPLLVYKPGNTAQLYAIITENKDRTFAIDEGICGDFSHEDLTTEIIDNIKKASFFHTTGFEVGIMKDSCLYAMKLAKENNLKVSFDIASYYFLSQHREIFIEAIKHSSIIFANEEELNAITSGRVINKINSCEKVTLNKLLDLCRDEIDEISSLAGIIVCKFGKYGAIVCQNKNYFLIPAYKAENFVNTLGAGDGFAAGFLYGLINNHDLETAGKIGAYYAYRVVEGVNARLGYKIENIASKI